MKTNRILLLTAFLLFLFLAANSQDISIRLNEANRLEAIPNEKAALIAFKEILKIQPLNLYALTKCSELCSRIAGREANAKTAESYNQAAIIYAKTALKLYPESDEANVAAAIALGRTILKKTGKEKISLVREIKHYADAALKVNSKNFKAWHVLGKWNYEIANLSTIEKTLASVLYGSLPNATFKTSIAAYEKARSINPNFGLNYLELAKAYEKNNNKPKAIALLKVLLTIPVQTEDDPRIRKEAIQLIRNWE